MQSRLNSGRLPAKKVQSTLYLHFDFEQRNLKINNERRQFSININIIIIFSGAHFSVSIYFVLLQKVSLASGFCKPHTISPPPPHIQQPQLQQHDAQNEIDLVAIPYRIIGYIDHSESRKISLFVEFISFFFFLFFSFIRSSGNGSSRFLLKFLQLLLLLLLFFS